jgi:hypothetical protein
MNCFLAVPISSFLVLLVVDGVELVHAAQVLLQDVLVGEGLVAVLHRALVAVWHLVDAVLVQRQAALPGEHLLFGDMQA